MWCLMVLAICAALGGLAALTIRPRRMHLPRPRPARLLRGCLAITCLLAALALAGAALLLASR